MSDGRAASAGVLASVGLLALANPLYLPRVLAINTGFALDEPFFAALGGLGLVALFGAFATVVAADERWGVEATLASVGVATLVAFPPYAWLFAASVVSGPTATAPDLPDGTVVASVVVALFVAGAAIAARRRRALVAIVPILVGGLVLDGLDAYRLLDPWRDPLAFLVFATVSIPGSGLLVYLAGVLLGVLFGRSVRAPSPEPDAAA